MTDLPEGWARANVTFDYPIDELKAARAFCARFSAYLDPDAYTNPAYRFDARLRAAAIEQIPAPKRQPKVGDVWRFKRIGHTRPVRAVDDDWVHLGPGSDGREPIVWMLDEFLERYEFVS